MIPSKSPTHEEIRKALFDVTGEIHDEDDSTVHAYHTILHDKTHLIDLRRDNINLNIQIQEGVSAFSDRMRVKLTAWEHLTPEQITVVTQQLYSVVMFLLYPGGPPPTKNDIEEILAQKRIASPHPETTSTLHTIIHDHRHPLTPSSSRSDIKKAVILWFNNENEEMQARRDLSKVLRALRSDQKEKQKLDPIWVPNPKYLHPIFEQVQDEQYDRLKRRFLNSMAKSIPIGNKQRVLLNRMLADLKKKDQVIMKSVSRYEQALHPIIPELVNGRLVLQVRRRGPGWYIPEEDVGLDQNVFKVLGMSYSSGHDVEITTSNGKRIGVPSYGLAFADHGGGIIRISDSMMREIGVKYKDMVTIRKISCSAQSISRIEHMSHAKESRLYGKPWNEEEMR